MFCSLKVLTTALQESIKLWNDSARPFKWTKSPDQIIDSICRYCRPNLTAAMASRAQRED